MYILRKHLRDKYVVVVLNYWLGYSNFIVLIFSWIIKDDVTSFENVLILMCLRRGNFTPSFAATLVFCSIQ